MVSNTMIPMQNSDPVSQPSDISTAAQGGNKTQRLAPLTKRKCQEPDLPKFDSVFSSSGSKPGFLELCAGSAILSYTADALGFFAIPVDYDRNKFVPKIPVVKMNLADDDCVTICSELIQSGIVQVVTAAIPCGTASRAREIYIPGGPVPLRSQQFPYGLPDLVGVELMRVETASRIYANCSKILRVAHFYDCIALAENPDKSLVWILQEFLILLDLGFVDAVFFSTLQVDTNKGYASEVDKAENQPADAVATEWPL